MTLQIMADNVSELSATAITNLFRFGYSYQSPKGEVRMASRVALTLTQPQRRHLNIVGRHSNIFQLIAETFWVCSGGTRVTGFLEHFLPRAPLYADDGVNWRGAYGGRIFKPLAGFGSNDAIEDVIELLKADPYTRQGHISISDVNKDMPTPLRVKENITSPKDVPCNTGMVFWVDPATNNLNLDVYQRSGDIFWGTGSINLFEFSFIHEYVWAKLDNNNIGLGSYQQNVINLHYYPQNIKGQAENVAKNLSTTIDKEMNLEPDTAWMIPPVDTGLRQLCYDLVLHFEDLITTKSSLTNIDTIFDRAGCPTILDNTLYLYALTVEAYINGTVTDLIDSCTLNHLPSLEQTIKDSKYYNAE